MSQRHHQLSHGVLQVLLNSSLCVVRTATGRVTDPAVAGQLGPDAFDRIKRDTQVDHAARLAHGQFETDQDDHFVRWHDLNQLRVALDALHLDIQLHGVAPPGRQLAQEHAGDATGQTQFDIAQRPLECRVTASHAAEHPIDDRVQQTGTDVENPVAFQRLWFEQVKAGGDLERVHKLAIGQLVDTDQFDFDNRAEQRDMDAPEISSETSCSDWRARICSLPTRSGRLKS